MRNAHLTFARLLIAAAAVLGLLAVAAPADAVIDSATVVSSPTMGSSGFFEEVSCVSASWCVAVGNYRLEDQNQSFLADKTLIEMWDGSTWSVATSADTADLGNYLGSVSCVSTSFCIAVGHYWTGGTDQTLIEMWDGSTWSIMTSPDGSVLPNYLTSVSCISEDFCAAVGYFRDMNSSGMTSLSMIWDGAAWSLAASPDPGGSDTYLNSVACVSSSSCVSAGSYDNGSVRQTLMNNWNGSSWSTVSSPNVGLGSNGLTSVSCLSESSCVAVGDSYDTISHTLVEVWDGSSWTVQSSPDMAPIMGNELSSVSCVSASACTAVGTYYGDVEQTFVMIWDGSDWTIVSTPVAGTGNEDLYSVSCATEWFCAAVGNFESDSTNRNLVLSLTGPEPPTTTTTTTVPDSSTTKVPTSSTTVGSDPVAPAFTG